MLFVVNGDDHVGSHYERLFCAAPAVLRYSTSADPGTATAAHQRPRARSTALLLCPIRANTRDDPSQLSPGIREAERVRIGSSFSFNRANG